MQIGELDRTAVRDVSDALLPRMPNAPVRSNEIKEEKKSIQNVREEERQQQQANAEKKKDKPTEFNENELRNTIEELNKHFKIFNTRLSFSFDEDSEVGVIKIQDRNSGEVIKQLPPQEMLDSLAKISSIVGLLIDKTT